MAKIVSNFDKRKIADEVEEKAGTELNYKKYLKEMTKDISLLHNQFAVFCLKDKKFYKLAVLDFRSMRFELWGERMTRWLRFCDGVLFNYMTDEKSFNDFYEQYKTTMQRPRSKESLLEWFKETEGRISFMPEYKELLKKREEEKNKNK